MTESLKSDLPGPVQSQGLTGSEEAVRTACTVIHLLLEDEPFIKGPSFEL